MALNNYMYAIPALAPLIVIRWFLPLCVALLHRHVSGQTGVKYLNCAAPVKAVASIKLRLGCCSWPRGFFLVLGSVTSYIDHGWSRLSHRRSSIQKSNGASPPPSLNSAPPVKVPGLIPGHLELNNYVYAILVIEGHPCECRLIHRSWIEPTTGKPPPIGKSRQPDAAPRLATVFAGCCS